MNDTGRLTRGLHPTVTRLLFDRDAGRRLRELRMISRVDCAHLLMLAEQGLLPDATVRRALGAIVDLAAQDFAPLRGRAADRGVYLLYEDYLRETHGDRVGGILQTARSRNDLNATLMKLRARAAYVRVLGRALQLQATVLQKAAQHADAVMPAYTHYQAAVPITFGHYLAGIAAALDRDISGIMRAAAGLAESPLGAGAVGGTDWRIDTARTAALLGFARGPRNSVDAVASRDLPLRLLSALAIYVTTIARLASDLLLWTTAEFAFVELPDELTGSSSAMPQKRNPFVLEHVRGRAATVTGALVTALSATHAAPFTNSIEAGTEALRPFANGVRAAIDVTVLMRLVLTFARPRRATMRRRAETGHTAATALANRLVRETAMDFRTAHRTVGALVRSAVERDMPIVDLAGSRFGALCVELPAGSCDVGSICAASAYGGGPAAASIAAALNVLRKERRRKARVRRAQARRWREAQVRMEHDVTQYLTRRHADRAAVYFFCVDEARDPVAHHVWRAVQRLYVPAEGDVVVDGRRVLVHRDAAHNRFVFVATDRVVSEAWPSYLPVLTRELADAELSAVVNWHEGAHAPDRILCMHTSGDVTDGVFGATDAILNRQLTLALERHRQGLGLFDWTTLVEATHWAGSKHDAPAARINDYGVPLVEIEIGSTRESWSDGRAAEAIARSLVEVFADPSDPPRALIALGGCHFEPVFTQATLCDQGWAIAHVLPSRWLVDGRYGEADGESKLEACLRSVKGGVQGIAYHDSLKSPYKARIRSVAARAGVAALSHRQLRAQCEAPLGEPVATA